MLSTLNKWLESNTVHVAQLQEKTLDNVKQLIQVMQSNVSISIEKVANKPLLISDDQVSTKLNYTTNIDKLS